METVKKSKYEVLGETGEINEVHTDRDTIMGNSTYGDSALGDNAKDEQILQPATPVEQWPTEAPEVSNTKENRSLEGQEETNQATSDDKDKGINLPKEKMEVGRNDEEEFVPNENKPPGDDDISEDDDKAAEEAVNEPYTEPGNEHTMQHVKRMYMTPIDVAATEDHDEN